MPVHLKVRTSEASPSLSTPSQLKLVLGYTFMHLGSETPGGGSENAVTFSDEAGRSLEFRFESGSSVGVPRFVMGGDAQARLQMVDAEGWATLSNPAFFDLYPGDGSVWRYVASPAAADFGALARYVNPRGAAYTWDDMGVAVLRDASGFLRQVATRTRLADIVVHSATHYTVTVYPLTEDPQTDPDTGLLSLPPHDPVRVLDVRRGTTDRELIVGYQKGTGDMRTYRYVAKNGDWELTNPSGLVDANELYFADDETGARRIHVWKDSDGTALRRMEANFVDKPWGWAMTNFVEGIPGDATRTTSWSYFESGSHRGLVQEQITPTGNRILYEYDAQNRLICESMPLVEEETLYSYEPVDPSDPPLLCDTRPRCVVRKMQGIEVQRTYYVYGTNGVDVVERVGEQGAAYGGTNVLRTVTTYYPVTGAITDGLVQSVRHEDGTIDNYAYDLTDGVWTETVMHVHEKAFDAVPYETIRTISAFNQLGRMIMWGKQLLLDGDRWRSLQQESFSYDAIGNQVSHCDIRGRTEKNEWGGACCEKLSSTTWDGIVSIYSYDEEGRIVIVRNLATETETRFAYDKLGREISRFETNEVEQIGSPIHAMRYDALGRIKAQNNPSDVWMTINYENNGRRERIIEYSGLERIVELDFDDRVIISGGTAVPFRFHSYSVQSNGLQSEIVYYGPDNQSAHWQKFDRDMFGRTVAVSEPGFGNAIQETDYCYDTYGRLALQSKWIKENDGNTYCAGVHRFEYDLFGVETRRIFEFPPDNESSTIARTRILETRSRYTISDTEIWHEIEKRIGSSGTPGVGIHQQLLREKVCGFEGDEGVISETEIVNQYGQLARTWISHDPSNHIVVKSSIAFGATIPTEQHYRFGLPTKYISSTGVTYRFCYDGLGRMIEVENGVGVRSKKYYTKEGYLSAVKDGDGLVTTFEYDRLGRRIRTIDPTGREEVTVYTPRGQVSHRRGFSIPQWFSYDNEGRMTASATIRDANSVEELRVITNSMDVTSWSFDPATGLLISKRYADGNGLDYTYYPNGLLSSRTDARGIVSTFEYNAAGELTAVHHSDETPGAIFVRDNFGRITIAATDAGVTNAFHYSLEGACTNEIQQGYSINRAFNWPGNNFSISLEGIPQNSISTHYSYGPEGKLQEIRCGSDLFSFSYGQGTDMISAIASSTGWSREIIRLQSSGMPMAVTNRMNQFVISSFLYDRDILGRITSVIENHGGVERQRIFEYSKRSEIATEKVSSQIWNEAWTYDLAGNCTAINRNGRCEIRNNNGLNQLDCLIVGDEPAINLNYDQDGNLVSSGDGWHYSWDANNRLTTASSNNLSVAFEYDAFGRLITISQTGLTNSTQRWLWDGHKIIAELDVSTSNTLCTMNVWGPDIDGTEKRVGGVGGLLATQVSGSWYYPMFDGNGNISEYVDTNGIPVATFMYNAKGLLLSSEASGPIFSHRFSTKPYVDVLGLCVYQKRMYRPSLGIWLTRDLRQERSGTGLYTFLSNDAVNQVDVLGMDAGIRPIGPSASKPGCRVEYVPDRRECFCTSIEGKLYRKSCSAKCPPRLFDGFAEVGHWVQVCDPPEEPPAAPIPEPEPPEPTPAQDPIPEPEPIPPPPKPAPDIKPPPRPREPAARPQKCCDDDSIKAIIDLAKNLAGQLPRVGVPISLLNAAKSGCDAVSGPCKSYSLDTGSWSKCMDCAGAIAKMASSYIRVDLAAWNVCYPLYRLDGEIR